MTTSSLQRDHLITRALRICGVVADGQNPTVTQISTGASVLTEVLNELRVEGFDWYQVILEPIALTASSVVSNGGTYYTCILPHTSVANTEPGTGALWTTYWVATGTSGAAWALSTTYTAIGVLSLPATIDDVLLVYLRRTDGTDETPLTPWAYQDYSSWAHKATTGDPFAYYVEYVQPRKLYLSYQPSSASEFVIMVLSIQNLTPPTTATGLLGKESFWDSAIVYKLAATLADEYGLPLAERQWLLQQAMLKVSKAKGKDKRNPGARVSAGAY